MIYCGLLSKITVRKPGTEITLTHSLNWYLSSHVLEVMSGPSDQLPEVENGAVQIVLSVVGASFQVAVVRGFKDIGPKRSIQQTSNTCIKCQLFGNYRKQSYFHIKHHATSSLS